MIKWLAGARHQRLWRASFTLLVSAVLAGAIATSSVAAAPPTATTEASPVRFTATQLGSLSSLESMKTASRYQVVVIQATEANDVRAIRAADPGVRILLYQDPFLARPTDPRGLTVCSRYAGAGRWLLHSNRGSVIQDIHQSGNYLMNMGVPAYQQSCVEHAIRLAKSVGADGVFWDDVNAAVSWYVPRGESVPDYRSAAAWERVQTTFLKTTTAALHAAGLLAYANLGGASTVTGLWERWSSILDGSEEQSWNNWTYDGPGGVVKYWRKLLQEPIWSQAHGKYTILDSIDSGEAENTFGLASMLLVANGLTSYATPDFNQGDAEQWYPTYGAARRLGAPLGNYHRLANGTYERAFVNGSVVVNPTRQRHTVTLPDTLIDAATGKAVRRLSLGPISGDVLRTS